METPRSFWKTSSYSPIPGDPFRATRMNPWVIIGIHLLRNADKTLAFSIILLLLHGVTRNLKKELHGEKEYYFRNFLNLTTLAGRLPLRFGSYSIDVKEKSLTAFSV